MQVSERLQFAVRERSKFIERLQKFLVKRQRWAVSLEMEEVSRAIPANTALRHAAIHRLVDALHSRLQTNFIQAGAFNLNRPVFKGEPIALPLDQLGFRFVNHVSLPLSFQLVARICWNVMSTPRQVGRLRNDENESWECVDVHTVYNKYCAHREGITSHSNVVRKLYEEPSRMVIAIVSTTDDELLLREPSDILEDTQMLWEFTAHNQDADMTNLTIVGQSNATVHMEHEKMKHVPPTQVLASLEQVYVAKPATFLPEATLPIFQLFIERSKDFQERLAHAVSQASRGYSHFDDSYGRQL
ncbi:hypothetical protein Ae201684P_021483 [Aphanomyces euteiches]|uniref:START domain-containing protein n=1 Tax=Aphanomyces euteiches TaxID=100861 RepID=A0A6G0X7K4_9STRA|nr:hypothetical protein Ae201684_007610 [Aphanomyces euteiches]KAH9067323.1 hypothetical protein Ae201684P_021483 [Aphanomyces euteiches]